MLDTVKVFVYGTLKEGRALASSFDEYRVNVKKATTTGNMYHLYGYPGVIFGGNNIIKGELHEYVQPKDVIRSMDRIEGYVKKGDPFNLYNRIKRTVTTEDGEKVECYTYEYNHSVEDKELVESGEW